MLTLSPQFIAAIALSEIRTIDEETIQPFYASVGKYVRTQALRDLSNVLAAVYVLGYLPTQKFVLAVRHLAALSNTLSLPNRPVRLELLEVLPTLQMTAELEQYWIRSRYDAYTLNASKELEVSEPIAIAAASDEDDHRGSGRIEKPLTLEILRALGKEHKIRSWNLCDSEKLVERLKEKLGANYQEVIDRVL